MTLLGLQGYHPSPKTAQSGKTVEKGYSMGVDRRQYVLDLLRERFRDGHTDWTTISYLVNFAFREGYDEGYGDGWECKGYRQGLDDLAE